MFDLQSHHDAWNFLSSEYVGGASLPSWGTNCEGQNLPILGDVKGKTILELGCGSGDSIIYLLKQGATKVVAIDFSEKQIEIATQRIQAEFADENIWQRVSLIHQSLDEPLPSGPFDIALAIYSVGWAENPQKLMEKINQVLKPGGEFYFSWDHYLARVAELKDQQIVITGNYHQPTNLFRKNWKNSGIDIETHQLRPSDWFQMLTQAEFNVTGFWEPQPNAKSEPLSIYSETYAPEIAKQIPTCVIFRAKKEELYAK